MRDLPDLEQWKQACVLNDFGAARGLLDRFGWLEPLAEPLGAQWEAGVVERWKMACQLRADRVLVSVVKSHMHPSAPASYGELASVMLDGLISQKMSLRKDQALRCWEALFPVVTHLDDASASMMISLNKTEQVIEALGRGAWVPDCPTFLHALGRLEKDRRSSQLYDLIGYGLSRFPEWGREQSRSALHWLGVVWEQFGCPYVHAGLKAAAPSVRRMGEQVFEGLLESLEAGKALDQVSAMVEQQHWLEEPEGKDELEDFQRRWWRVLPLVSLLGRYGCDPFSFATPGVGDGVLRMAADLGEVEGLDLLERCQEDPWRRWFLDPRRREEVDLEVLAEHSPKAGRVWKAWQLERVFASSYPIEEPVKKRARL